MPELLIKTMKQGSTSPPIRAQLLSQTTGAAISLVGASVDFKMYQVNDDSTVTALVDAEGNIEDAANGIVNYEWQTGDTSVVGSHRAEFVVTFSGGEVESFPPQGFIEVRIESLP